MSMPADNGHRYRGGGSAMRAKREKVPSITESIPRRRRERG
jgi:hypothetical protein